MATARYDSVADFYEVFAPDRYDDPPLTARLRLIGDVSGLRLLDLTCGHGRLTRELARRGARVVGIDLSSALLDKARARELIDLLGITYVHGDAASPQALTGEVFDAVACSFGLLDIDDLDGAIATVARGWVLRLLDVASLFSRLAGKRRGPQLAAWTQLLCGGLVARRWPATPFAPKSRRDPSHVIYLLEHACPPCIAYRGSRRT